MYGVFRRCWSLSLRVLECADSLDRGNSSWVIEFDRLLVSAEHQFE